MAVGEKKGVVAVVLHGDKVLVGKKIKANHILSNQWHLPGGKPLEGESPEDAVVREVKEEAGLDAKVVKLLGENVNEEGYRVKWFLCRADSGDPRPGDDLAEARFVGRKEVFEVCSPKAVGMWPKEVRDFLR